MSRSYINWSRNRGTSNKRLEDVPPITNLSDGIRYYSAVDGELYFGDIFIDEVTNISWNVQQQTMPIYGYNSYTFDDIAVGSRLIQGQFAINFTKSNFLTNLQNNTSAFKQVSRRMYADDNPQTTSFSDYRKQLHLPMWDKGFDIVIGFGKVNGSISSLTSSSPYSTYVILNCVQVTSSTIQLDYNGNPVQEVYTFIARDMNTAKSSTYNSTNNNSKQDNSNNTSNNTISDNAEVIGYIDLTAYDKNINISTNNNIVLTKGTIQLTEASDATLRKEVTLIKSDSDNCLYYTFDKTFSLAFKKEFSSKDKVEAYIKYSCKNNENDNEKEYKQKIILNIKYN